MRAFFVLAALPFAAFLAEAARAQSPYPACRQLDLTAQQINGFGTEAVQQLRSIYTIHDLAFGGQETQEKCTAALLDALLLQQDLLAANDGDSLEMACEDMDGWIDSWRSASNGDIGRLRAAEAILAREGLSIDGPREDPAACERAFLTMQDAGILTYRGTDLDQPDPVQTDAFGRETLFATVATEWGPRFGGTAMTLWDHNGSQMAWEVGPGAMRRVWYWRPRSAIEARGVMPGQLLFDGERQGDRMVGTARVFTGGCGVWTYPVEGPITNNDERVTMNGLAPVVDGSCRVTGTRQDTLVFTFQAMQPGAAPAPTPTAACGVPAPEDPPAFGIYTAQLAVRRVAANDTLNVRSGPTTQCGVLWELPSNAAGILVEVGGCTGAYIDPVRWDRLSLAQRTETLRGRWCHVSWGGRSGWASGSYLEVLG